MKFGSFIIIKIPKKATLKLVENVIYPCNIFEMSTSDFENEQILYLLKTA